MMTNRIQPNYALAALSVTLAMTGMAGASPAADTNPPPALQPAATNSHPVLPSRPLALAECLDIALQQNANIQKSKSDIEAAYGVVIQTRAIALPKLQGTGNYQYNDQIETLPFSFPGSSVNSFTKVHSWNAGLRIVQSLYEGGRVKSALHTARLTKEQALLQHQTVVMDTVLAVRVAFYDVLMSEQQIVVQEASVKLLQKELDDTTRRYNAGTVPRFNVLRSEVELANAKPKLFHAKNAYRIAKNNLALALGYRVPPTVWEDIPLQLAGKLDAEPFQVELPIALADALEKRPELAQLRKAERLRWEAVKTAKSGYLPSVQLFGGYGWRNSTFQQEYLINDVAGWNAGAQVTWNFFDGQLTKGKVREAEALLAKSKTEIEDKTRQVELDVRTAYSSFVEAQEVLESQKKVVEQAEEALRLAMAREDAGAGTQLDTLNAQTALTQARTTQIQALHDYAVARARLERAMGK
ncbi:MAG: TolC family protein [Verrucomicrobia bacterium]|nr:TolC family protein [Verrucomicrobiota bacterium]